MKILKKALVFLLIIFVIMQFFSPEKNQGEAISLVPFINETNPPEDVHKILKETCFDCHSDITRYPWLTVLLPLITGWTGI